MKKIFSFLFYLLICQLTFGQVYRGNIQAVSQNGLHKIVLTPEVRSFSKDDMAHIRIYDAQKKEIPFVVFDENRSESTAVNFPIIDKKAINNVSSTFVFANESNQKMDGLVLEIANTAVSKKFHISGSNDANEWFGLVNNQTISGLSDSYGTSVERLFSFPLNNYKFIKFEFIDKNSLPINVLSASLYNNFVLKNEEVTLTNFEQKIILDKKLKQTQIDVSFSEPQLIDGIKFNIVGPNHYLREAKIIVNKTQQMKRKVENYQETIAYFQLNSKNKNKFSLPNLFENQFSIIIENADNQELEIEKIQLFQQTKYLIADLKSNEKYSIQIDDQLRAPVYDLAQSGIDFNAEYPSTTISDLEQVNQNTQVVKPLKFWQTPTFMWICIVLAVLVLGYFSVSMIREMGKK